MYDRKNPLIIKLYEKNSNQESYVDRWIWGPFEFSKQIVKKYSFPCFPFPLTAVGVAVSLCYFPSVFGKGGVRGILNWISFCLQSHKDGVLPVNVVIYFTVVTQQSSLFTATSVRVR